MLHGALFGLLCFYGAICGEALLHRWIESAPKQWWRRALVYFVGGQIGWFMAMFLGILLIWREPISSVRMPRACGSLCWYAE